MFGRSRKIPAHRIRPRPAITSEQMARAMDELVEELLAEPGVVVVVEAGRYIAQRVGERGSGPRMMPDPLPLPGGGSVSAGDATGASGDGWTSSSSDRSP